MADEEKPNPFAGVLKKRASRAGGDSAAAKEIAAAKAAAGDAGEASAEGNPFGNVLKKRLLTLTLADTRGQIEGFQMRRQ